MSRFDLDVKIRTVLNIIITRRMMRKIFLAGSILLVGFALLGCQTTSKTTPTGNTDDAESDSIEVESTTTVPAPPVPPAPSATQ